MIKHISLQTASVRLQNLWLDIWRQIQRYIEHSPMTNGEGAASIGLGNVVHCSGERTVKLAITDSVAHASTIGVVDDSTTLPGHQCVVAHDGYRLVKFVDGLDATLTAGDNAYTCDTAGSADRAPDATYSYSIGKVADASMYNGVQGVGHYPYAMVLLGGGCCIIGQR